MKRHSHLTSVHSVICVSINKTQHTYSHHGLVPTELIRFCRTSMRALLGLLVVIVLATGVVQAQDQVAVQIGSISPSLGTLGGGTR